MQQDPIPEPRSRLKNPLVYSTAILVVALLGVVYVMLSRWQETRYAERQATRERVQKQREEDRIAVEQLGGKEFAILDFYASPKTIRRGESAQLCYGVANAKTVKLEPQSKPVWPSGARCVEVSPSKSTTYTLTIEDARSNTKSQTVDVEVR